MKFIKSSPSKIVVVVVVETDFDSERIVHTKVFLLGVWDFERIVVEYCTT